MKRTILFLVLLSVFSFTFVFADVRIDLGVDIPFGFSGIADSPSIDADVSTFFREHIIPFPEAGLYYSFKTGPVTFGLGARAFSFILESIAWPNAYAEWEIGPLAIEGQVGGGAFLLFGLLNKVETGQIFFPDLSAWLKIGKSFRLGGGAIGLFIDQVERDTVPVVFYIGIKSAMKL